MRNIYYIVDSLTGSKGNGISSQAKTWAEILSKFTPLGVTQVSPWEDYDYNKGDIVHLFGSGGVWFYDVAKNLKERGCKVVWSPICDNIDSPIIQRVKTYIGLSKLQVFSCPMIRRRAFGLMDRIFVRSYYEKEYIRVAYGVDEKKVDIVPLSMTYDGVEGVDLLCRKDFCLHISSIYQGRKNVLRLIRAAKKYNFHLVLAGNKGSERQFKPIEEEIGGFNNIEVLGFVSDKEKIDLYKRAKVFALPSMKEGVGIVALDAAHFGCEIVVTDIGGPKEYYNNMAYVVNPYDVDSIGLAIQAALGNSKTNQPKLSEWVNKMFSQRSIADRLYNSYLKIV